MIAKFGPYKLITRWCLKPSQALVNAAYGAIGYKTETRLSKYDTVLDVEHHLDGVVATATLRIDSKYKLRADASYSAVLDGLRFSGCKLSEMTRFVVAKGHPVRSVMGMLYHGLYICGGMKYGATDLLCEVTPRHVAAQTRLVKFQKIGDLTRCERVGVEVVLLHRKLTEEE